MRKRNDFYLNVNNSMVKEQCAWDNWPHRYEEDNCVVWRHGQPQLYSRDASNMLDGTSSSSFDAHTLDKKLGCRVEVLGILTLLSDSSSIIKKIRWDSFSGLFPAGYRFASRWRRVFWASHWIIYFVKVTMKLKLKHFMEYCSVHYK